MLIEVKIENYCSFFKPPVCHGARIETLLVNETRLILEESIDLNGFKALPPSQFDYVHEKCLLIFYKKVNAGNLQDRLRKNDCKLTFNTIHQNVCSCTKYRSRWIQSKDEQTNDA